MSEITNGNGQHETVSKDQSSATSPQGSGPTHEERARLIGALQAHALQRTEPLSANLGMLCADLIACANRVSETLTNESPNVPVTSAAFRAFEKKADLLLKLTRQIDRFAHIQQQQAAAEAAE